MTTRSATCRIFDLDTALDVMAAVEDTGSDVLAMLTTGVTFGALDWSDVADCYASPIGPCAACAACSGRGKVYVWTHSRGRHNRDVDVRETRVCATCGGEGTATIDGDARHTITTHCAVEFVRVGRDRFNTILRATGEGDRRFAE